MKLACKIPLILVLALYNHVFGQTVVDGDIVFIKNKIIKGKTALPNGKSKFNYAGIVFIEDKIPVVYHATQPFSKCSFEEFIALSENKEFEVKSLSDESVLTNDILESMHKYAVSKLGSAYDNNLKLNNDDLYNAEFVWKIYQDGIGLSLCIPREIKDFKVENAAITGFLTESYGEAILTEKIVSIGDIYQSQFLD